ncbi:sugar phosphate isomerase/epimerase family protein [Kouleothrix sp.]|uniref:sugar phosphate isomerase/epimerase family protein n=1 Tax=Kouleothrix sp. TaxID=2779161 RepID=UPI00391B7140
MTTLPIAAQLYTVRAQMAQDFAGTLRAVAALGYDGVEFAGLFNTPASEARALLDELGLRVCSSHVALNLLEQQFDETIASYQALGCPIVVVPWIDASLRGDYAALGERLERLGERVRAAGLRLAYHNHDFELAGDDGASGLAQLAAASQRLEFELDCGWVYKAGKSVPAQIAALAGRLPLLHIKDVDAAGRWAEAGHGEVGYAPVVAGAAANGAEWLIVELDECPRPELESLRMSLQWLRAQSA